MFKKQSSGLNLCMILCDLALIVCAYFLSFPVRQLVVDFYGWDLFPTIDVLAPELANLEGYLVVLPLSALSILLCLHYSGVYTSFQRLRYSDVVWLVVSSVLLGMGILGAILYGMKMHFVSRSLLVVMAGLNAVLLTTEKLLFQYYLRWAWRHGVNCKNLLLVGTGKRAVAFVEKMKKQAEWGFRVVGCVDEDVSNGNDLKAMDVPMLGKLEDIPSILKNHVIDTVVFVVPRMWLERIGSHIQECELQGKEVSVALDLYDHYIGQVHLSALAGVPVLSFETTFLNRWEVFVKRAIDLLVSLVCIILLSPLLIAIAIYIKVVSPGPVFFIQKRCGLNGRVFPMLKFRTMVVGADKMLDEIKHLNEAISGPGFKMDNDPRFIKGAKLLRKYSLDEIPQLFNVFWGHMSLVGPRPPIPYEVNEYDDWQRRRMSVRPGMTCLWQIGGRTNIGFEEQLNLDLRYIDQWSLWLDLKIILKTFPVVVAGTGK